MLITTGINAAGQCPVNIDGETGDFTNWVAYSGNGTLAGPQLYPTNTPLIGIHDIIDGYYLPGNEPRGQFPLTSPNGSRYIYKLSGLGLKAAGLGYTFTIPATANHFTLNYYYALVMENPGHTHEQQPRVDITLQNLSTGNMNSCSSFTYVSDGQLPGFYPSSVEGTAICRGWTRNVINLDGQEGQTYQIFFKAQGCALGAHSSYLFFDIDTECSPYFPGASYCPGDTSVDLEAPANYQSYEWYDASHSQVLGTQPVLHIAPPPPPGSHYTVEVTPYTGYGCASVFDAEITDNFHVTANAGADTTLCEGKSVLIGGPLSPGVHYSWSPPTGLSNPNIPNPVATVPGTTTYILTASSHGGGCISKDTITIHKDVIPIITIIGSSTSCLNPGQTISLQVNPAPYIQWYKDGVAIPGANQPLYTVTESGLYHAELSSGSCTLASKPQRINVFYTPSSGFTVDNGSQCFSDNNFVFTNSNGTAPGITYHWDFGDNQTSSSVSPAHSYAGPGTYTVTFSARSAGGCTAGSTQTVTVKPNARANFSVVPKCINLQTDFKNTSLAPGAPAINYLWDFGDGNTSSVFSPSHVYTAGGHYTIKLSASSAACPIPYEKQQQIIIDEPAVPVRYADQTAMMNFPKQLSVRGFANAARWNPGINLSDPYSTKPVFRGFNSQLYDITLTTKTGCVTVDTLFVKTIKQISIFVPTAFTPNGDGINDYLKPLLYGFKKVNWFRIYNRWGKLIFQSEDDLKGWDGKISEIPQDTQTFIWMISAVDVDGVTHVEKGTTSVVR